jgi:hypothetical protein
MHQWQVIQLFGWSGSSRVRFVFWLSFFFFFLFLPFPSIFADPECRNNTGFIGYYNDYSCGNRFTWQINATLYAGGFTGTPPICTTTMQTTIPVATTPSTSSRTLDPLQEAAFLYAGISVLSVLAFAFALMIIVWCCRRRQRKASYQQM